MRGTSSVAPLCVKDNTRIMTGTRRSIWRTLGMAASVVMIGAVYVVGAVHQADTMNTDLNRADQRSYLAYAKEMAETNYEVVGGRNRMPIYSFFLSRFYRPGMTDEDFFQIGKRANIALSVLLLLVLLPILIWNLPFWLAIELELLAAFTVFIFKAGYTQPELLYYFLFFVALLLLCRVVIRRGVVTAVAAGVSLGAAHLTKAGVLPLIGLFCLVFVAQELLVFWRSRQDTRIGLHARLLELGRGIAVLAVVLASFITTMYPYISTSKQVFGRYFYNVNSTFYIWYDSWDEVEAGTKKSGDRIGWPKMPPEDLPSARKYWATHSLRQIAMRMAGGLRAIMRESYRGYWYMKFVVLYLLVVGALLLSHSGPFKQILRDVPGAAALVVLALGGYCLLSVFYAPISATGNTRHVLALFLPAMFAMTYVMARYRDALLPLGAVIRSPVLTMTHFHLFVATTLALDIIFSVWPLLGRHFSGV